MYKSRSFRFLCAVLAIVFSVSLLLVGCGTKTTSDETASTTQAATQATTQATTVKELEPVNLVWHFIGTKPKDADAVYAKVNEMIKGKINATVNFDIIDWGDYAQKMQLIIASLEPYDICFTSDWVNFYSPNVAKGAFKPLDELIDTYAPGTKTLIPGVIWDACKIKGKIYGVPNYQVSFRQAALAFKKDIVEKYKFDLSTVKKLEDLEPFFEQVVKNEPGMYALQGGKDKGIYPAEEYLEQLNFNVPLAVNSSLKVVSLLDEPKRIARYALNRKWFLKGFYPKDIVAPKDKSFSDLCKAGKILAIEDVLKPGGDADMKQRYGYDFISIPLEPALLSTGSISASLNAIGVNSPNPERAMMLLELMNTDKELYNTIVFGIEGKHYKKVSENRVEPIKDSGYEGIAWEMGCQFNAYLMPGQDDNVWEQTKEMNMSANKSVVLGFTFDSEPVKNEIAAITAVHKEYEGIANGIIDYLSIQKEYTSKMEAAGLKKVADEMQKQIDEWAATK